MDTREHLIDWLRDAPGMEAEALDILEKQAARLESYPEMEARVQQDAEETHRQAERVAGCIERLGGDTSTVNDVTGKVMGTMAALTNAMARDQGVKKALADYAFEHFEITCYRSLIAAAVAAGDTQTAEVCRDILREEEAMADGVGERIPAVTQSFLQRDATVLQAKR